LRSKCALLAPVCLLVLGAARNAAADTITVGWDQGSSTVGYRVHIGVQSGTYTQHVDVGSANLFAFTTATAGQRYCFAVSAYMTSSRVEGPNSGEVCGYSNATPTLVNPGSRSSTVGQPTVVLADEPISEVDEGNGERILAALWEVASRGGAVVVATHDPQAIEYATRAMLLRDGRVEAEGDPAELRASLTTD